MYQSGIVYLTLSLTCYDDLSSAAVGAELVSAGACVYASIRRLHTGEMQLFSCKSEQCTLLVQRYRLAGKCRIISAY